MKLPSWFPFTKKQKDLEFVDTLRQSYLTHPIQRACDVKPLTFEHQKKNFGKHIFAHCPGMHAYAEMGYIMPAWVDIKIMANPAGVVWSVGSKERGSRGFSEGRMMDSNSLEPLYTVEDGIPRTALNFSSPWAAFASKDISCLLLPAWFHSDFFDDLHVIPGVVDYTKFHTMNFICMPRRKCKIHIKAGDPLLHIIPIHNSKIIAGYGPGDQVQLDTFKNEIPDDTPQYYRKNQMTKKEYNLEGDNE